MTGLPGTRSSDGRRRRCPDASSWHLEIPDVPRWTAETPGPPRPARSPCASPDGEVVERHVVRIGFRRVEIRGLDLLFNGQRDLHPRRQPPRLRPAHRPRHLRRVDARGPRGDEAVRVQRGPDLALPERPGLPRPHRRAGLYVIDEADIESHAFQSTLCDDPRYLNQWVSRVSRMVLRDRNHPSVFAWSLGNESGFGSNHEAAAAWVRRVDPSRPLHYEGAIRWDWTADQDGSDLTCPMYPAISAIVDHARSGLPAAPADHVRVLARDGQQQRDARRVLGRHRVDARAPGRVHLGVVGPRPRPDAARRHDSAGPTAATSATSPTTATSAPTAWSGRTARPKPALWEHRALAAPVAIGGRPADVMHGRIEVHEPAATSATSAGCVAAVELAVDGDVVSAGRPSSCPRSGPASTPRSRCPDGPRRACRAGREAWLTIAVPDGRRERLGAAGLRGLRAPGPGRARGRAAACLATRAGGRRRAGLARRRRAGSSTRCSRRRRPCPCGARRPTTTGSAGWVGAGPTGAWTASSADLLDIAPRRATRPSCATRSAPAPGSRSATSSGSRPCADGGDRGRRDRRHPRRRSTDLARVGTVLETVAGLEALEWFGTGPHETYPDRKRGGLVGRWRSSVTDQYVPYIRPQENGGHADVRWLSLTDATGRGLRLVLDEPRQVSATHLRAADLAAATHDVELTPTARDDRPPRRGPPRPRAPPAAGRTPCPRTSSDPARTSGRWSLHPLQPA